MPAETALAYTPQEDGSMDDAIAAMPDVEALDLPDPGGTSDAVKLSLAARSRDDDPEADAPAAKVKPADVKEKDDAPAKTEAEEDEADYIELPAEVEGKAPERLKLDDVLAGYRKAATLDVELTKARRNSAILPAEIEQQLSALQEESAKHIQALKAMDQVMLPPMPDFNMTNPAAANYNPEQFFADLQRYNGAVNAASERAAKAKTLETEQDERSKKLSASRSQREAAKIQEFWPEILTDAATAKKAVAHLKDVLGFDDATINSVIDHRFYHLAKRSLELEEIRGKQAAAVKIAKAKPRLVTSSARGKPSTEAATRAASAYRSLASSGTMEDAVAALDGLISE